MKVGKRLRRAVLSLLVFWGLFGQGQSPTDVLAAGPDHISGTVFLDMNWNGMMDGGEFGLTGVVVQLVNPSGAISQTMTDTNGVYSLTTTETGSHTLNVQTPAGYSATSSPSDLVDKSAGQEAGGNNFGLQLQSVPSPTPTQPSFGALPGSISGFVYHDLNGNGRLDQAEPAVVGVSIKLEGVRTGTTQSDDSGFYRFADLSNGLYSVSPDWAAIDYRPMSEAILVANITPGVGFADRNFGGQPIPATATPTPTPTSTATALPTVQPTNTPLPTATPAPTNTPEPTAVPMNAGSCRVMPDPARSPAGRDITFIGSGFGQNEAAAIGLVFPDSSVVGLPAQATLGAGSFAFTYHTEPGDPIGLYTLVAEGQNSHCRASGAFYLDDAAEPTPVSVVITSPTDGSYGVGGGGPLMLGSMPIAPTAEAVDPAVVAAASDPLLTNIELRSFTEADGGSGQAQVEPSELPGLGGSSLLPLRVIGVMVILGLIVLVIYMLMSGSMVAHWVSIYLKGGRR